MVVVEADFAISSVFYQSGFLLEDPVSKLEELTLVPFLSRLLPSYLVAVAESIATRTG
jgi:hypothetical protein